MAPEHDQSEPAPRVRYVEDPENARDYLARVGRLRPGMSDSDVVAEARAAIRGAVPAPSIRAGTPPVSARVWLSEALVARGFSPPEDHHQRAVLDDAETTVDLSVLACLVMRHLTSDRPADWDDSGLARMLRQPSGDIALVQDLLDGVALDVGIPATNGAYWWEST